MREWRAWLARIGRWLMGEALAHEADRQRLAADRLDRTVREVLER